MSKAVDGGHTTLSGGLDFESNNEAKKLITDSNFVVLPGNMVIVTCLTPETLHDSPADISQHCRIGRT